MIKLLKSLIVDYSFTGASVATDAQDVVYINDNAGLTFDEGSEPLATFPTLRDAIVEMGSLEALLLLACGRGRTTYFIMDDDDIVLLLALFFRGLYPNIGYEMFHRLIKLTIADQKYGKNRPSRTFATKDDQVNLTIPTQRTTKQLYDETSDAEYLSDAIRGALSLEYLLAHSLAWEFDAKDPYVQRFVTEFEQYLWSLLVADYQKNKRRLTMGLFGWNRNLGLDIDPLADDIEAEIAKLDEHSLFGVLSDADMSEQTAENIQRVFNSVETINELNGHDDSFKEVLARMFVSDQGLSAEEVAKIIYHDKERQWSTLLGRSKQQRGINSLFVSYLFDADLGRLKRLSLT